MYSNIFKFILLINFLFFQNNYSYTEEFQDFYNEKYCENTNPENLIQYKIPEEINIEIKNSKKWAKNLFELFTEANLSKYKTNNTGWYTFQIDKKYKKKFKSEISFLFSDPSYLCLSKAEVSVKGDLWWHLKWSNGYPFSSMRVDLIDGHLNNTVKFNLLIPDARTSENKNINLELFITTLFSHLNLLAPDSYLVKVMVNGHKYKNYLMQEGLEKEFLEKRGYIEGPIFEGDQRFTTENFSSGKWRGDLGLAKQINSSYSEKNEASKGLSFYALSLLNSIYLDNYQESEDITQSRCINNIFSIDKKKYIKNQRELEINQLFEALVVATEATHGLTCDDRKFYFDPIYKIFLPIYNDGKSTLDFNNENSYDLFKKNQVSLNSIEGSENALNKIYKIDDDLFFQELKKKGFELNFNEYKKIKLKVVNNLKILKNLKESNIFKNNEDYFNKIDPNYFGKKIKLVFFNFQDNYFEICDFNLKNCNERQVKKNETLYKYFLSQDFDKLKKKNILDNNYYYLFLSTTKKYSSITEIQNKSEIYNFNKIQINQDFEILHNDSIETKVDYINKKIEFILQNQNGRAIILGDVVNAWNISLSGENFYKKNDNLIFEKKMDMLTGCVSFIDIELVDVNIFSRYSLCEDAVNFIRTKGIINKIEAINSYSDALDFDFSKIIINNIYVNKAANDCLDFSFGEYVVTKSIIIDCGDKGISIGEKSTLKANTVAITETKIGIAAKDSSIVNVHNASIKSKICLAAYRKKQEFSGSLINYTNLDCSNKSFLSQSNSIIKKNEF